MPSLPTSTMLRLIPATIALLISIEAQAIILFDSFTPPSTTGGFSSPNNGAANQLSVAIDTEITGISVLNQMLSDGELRFVVLGGPPYEILHITSAESFIAEDSETWKRSPDFSFTLLAGNQYLVGYVRSVGVNDIGDHISETQNGITSDLFVACLRGFASPSYSHHCLGGIDFGVRLHALPEPTVAVEIDIRPWSDRNLIYPFSRLIVPVALLGSDDFDVTDTDVSTLAFGPDGAAPAFDLTNPWVYWLSHWDVNGDGKKDLLSSYRTEETGIAFGDTEACLTGETLDSVPLEGCDDITTELSCGLGAELALLLPPLMWLYGRRRRRV